MLQLHFVNSNFKETAIKLHLINSAGSNLIIG